MTPTQVWPAHLAQRYRERGYWTGETFSALLRRQATAHPTRTVVSDNQQRWSYSELLERAETAAAGFVALGLAPGERVIVQLGNIADFLSVTFGLFRAQLVPVFALPAHRHTEIGHFANKAEAAAIVVGPTPDRFDYIGMAKKVQAAQPSLRHIIAVGTGTASTALHPATTSSQRHADKGYVCFDDFVANPASLPADDADPASVALLQISGGSTGLSKLIPRTHNDYLYSCRASAPIAGLTPNSVYLVALPVSHNFPMSSPGIFGVICAAARLVLAPSPSPQIAFPLIEQEGVTITGLVPPLALLWLQAAAASKADISSLEVLQVGGAKFMPEAARRVKPTLGCTLQQVFGMAEGLVNYTRLDDPEELIVTTQGRPISPDDEILIVDDDGQPVAAGENGHLLTRGPYTLNAYHNAASANERSFTADGYYRTGDIVRRTPTGYLEVQGRATDHINRAGEKISAEEVEDHLIAHPQVFDAALVAVPDSFLGERSCAFIIIDSTQPGTAAPKAADIKRWIRSRGLADFKVPDQVTFIDSFDTTAVGKISRKQLRAQLAASLTHHQDASL